MRETGNFKPGSTRKKGNTNPTRREGNSDPTMEEVNSDSYPTPTVGAGNSDSDPTGEEGHSHPSQQDMRDGSPGGMSGRSPEARSGGSRTLGLELSRCWQVGQERPQVHGCT
jgi:hypothetical protein